MSLSFTVTCYEEMTDLRKQGQRLLRSISAARQHPGIDEIVVVDDASDNFDRLKDLLNGMPEVRLYRNETNRGVFGNKLESVARSTGEWVIMSDSDNFRGKAFIDKILVTDKNPQTWYCPTFARPRFDYRGLVGEYDLASISRILHIPMFNCLINTGNQTVHRDEYMKVFGKYRNKRADLMMPNWLGIAQREREKHHWRLVFDALDSFLFNMEWLTAGNRLHIMPGLEYDHFCDDSAVSNYNRAPKEKDELGPILMKELRARSQKALR